VFEQNYACLNITCEQIGGLWQEDLVVGSSADGGEYLEHFAPCVTPVVIEDACVLVNTQQAGVDEPLLKQLNSQPALIGGALVFIGAVLTGLCCFAAQKLKTARGVIRLTLSIVDIVLDVLFLSEVALLHFAQQSRGCTDMAVFIVLVVDVAALASASVLGAACISWCLHADKEHIDSVKLLRYLPFYTLLLMLTVFDMEVTRFIFHDAPLHFSTHTQRAHTRTHARACAIADSLLALPTYVCTNSASTPSTVDQHKV
jgi:hypothetical protein